MTFAEMMFYAEEEGLLPTRAGRINAVIEEIRTYPRPDIEAEEFESILNRHQLSDLTEKELRYIYNTIKD